MPARVVPMLGMREFIVKDLNGFWLTFGQPLENERKDD